MLYIYSSTFEYYYNNSSDKRLNENLDKGADEYYNSYGIFSHKTNETFNLYPNPASGVVFMDYELNNADFDFVEILDLNGRVVKKLSEFPGSGITISSFPSGVYLIRLSENREIKHSKIIVE